MEELIPSLTLIFRKGVGRALSKLRSMTKSDTTESLEELKKQAELLRQSSRGKRDHSSKSNSEKWKHYTCWSVSFGVLIIAVFLLVSAGSRLQLITFLGEGWIALFDFRQSKIFRLDPPPPKRSSVKDSKMTFDSDGLKSEDSPKSVFTSPNSIVRQRSRERGIDQFSTLTSIPLVKNSVSEQAYDLLRKKSDLVNQLIDGYLPEFKFKSWNVLKDNAPDFWIDITVIRQSMVIDSSGSTQNKDGQEVHFVWSVNLESDEVVALSQEARDLEGTLKE
jgi:hypothetical protein